MREYLTNVEGFSEDHVVWLTDGGPRLPTRANILAALENLEEKLAAVDFALLYFAGHGSRQPARARASEEFDGYDEIFLPVRHKRLESKIWRLSKRPSSMMKSTWKFISAYRRRRADVWVIFDSCHSGTMTRGVGDESKRTRRAPPEALDIPELKVDSDAPDSQIPGFVDVSGGLLESKLGALIAFSAAHSSEETPEFRLPRGVEKSERKVMGLFTHSIIKTLGRFPNVSYDDLAQMITSEYASIPHFKSTPQFYRTDMNRGVFGRDHEREPVFPATADSADRSQLRVAAGKLRGFDVGAGASIHANPADENVLGTGMVVEATNTPSTIETEWKEDS